MGQRRCQRRGGNARRNSTNKGRCRQRREGKEGRSSMNMMGGGFEYDGF